VFRVKGSGNKVVRVKGARCLGLREQGVYGYGIKVLRVKGARCLGLREQGL
jgi:hypothetical protein